MTLKELELIKEKLERVPGCFTEKERDNCSSCKATKQAIEVIDREIRLKKLDPIK